MTINFRKQIEHTAANVDRQITNLINQVDELRSLSATMKNHASKFGSPTIQPVEYPDVRWRVWIPPFREEHYDGEAIVDPFGDTYWSTLPEACEFLDGVLAGIEAVEYGPLAPQS